MIAELVARASVTHVVVGEMFALLDAHFENVTRARFERDLAGKNWVLLLREPDGTLAGFSTILFCETERDGERVSVVYSGDTIVDPRHWSSPALSRSWIASVLELQSRASTSRIYWLLLTSGFRTYRFLPLFWRSFHPRYDVETPAAEARWIERLAVSLPGGDYDSATGIVRFAEPARLRPHLRQLPEGRLHDPHVRYFLERNPGHENGDEFVCLTEIAESNLTRAGWRMVRPAAVPDEAARR